MEIVPIPESVAEEMKDGGKPAAFWWNGIMVTCDRIAPDSPEAWFNLVDLKALFQKVAGERSAADSLREAARGVFGVPDGTP